MNWLRPGWQRLFPLLMLAACSACSGPHPLPETDPGHALSKAEFLKLPGSYRMVHRVRLNVRGRSLDFIGYLAVSGDCLRAVALMEVGGEVFDLLVGADGMSVLKNPGRVPQAALRRGVMRELAWIFTPLASTAAETGATREKISIKAKGPGADAGGELLVFKNGRLFSQVEITSWQTIAGWPHPFPGSFTLKNMHWGYEMTVELLRMDMRPVEKKVFLVK